jgi:NAD(P)-dependent dehydrogenase (short-subunit alcohol dehydrogenase family)
VADLSGRVAIVTGANRGIGFETCRQLGRLGARVVLGSRVAARGDEAESVLRGEGLDVSSHQLDVTDQSSVDALASWLVSAYGRLDVLVNNAAIMPNEKRFRDVTLDEAQAVWQVNVLGAWRTSLALLPLMQRNRWGRIVNVSSQGGSLARMTSSAAAYRVSKTGLNALTRVMAGDLRSSGVLVNAVCPGWVASDMGGAGAPRSLPEGAASVIWAVALPDDGPTGGFYRDGKPLPW